MSGTANTSTQEAPPPGMNDQTSAAAVTERDVHARSYDNVVKLCSATSDVKFSVKVECTSLTLSQCGGRPCIIAGFADGTVRLFDVGQPNDDGHQSSLVGSSNTTGRIAARICAKGVHTALRLHVAASGEWAFAGAVRGSTELLAIRLDTDNTHSCSPHTTNAIDLPVYRQSDAKLRGFGASQKLEYSDTYLLLTGKAIKNIHIWSFQPPPSSSTLAASFSNENNGATPQPTWQCLYDCPTNGNTIKWLHFRHSVDVTSNGNKRSMLQAISKSDGQKLRVWDLSHEDTPRGKTPSDQPNNRPSRPPFQDVANTESALAIAGNLVICGGTVWFNQMSLVSLDTLVAEPTVSSSSTVVYNHTELALPGDVDAEQQLSLSSSTAFGTSTTLAGGTLSSQRRARPQRGDVQCVVEASGVDGFVLVQLSNGSMAAYQPQSSQGVVVALSRVKPLPSGHVRHFQVHRVARMGTAVVNNGMLDDIAVMATYNPFTGWSKIGLQSLQDEIPGGKPLAVSNSLSAATVAWAAAAPPIRLSDQENKTPRDRARPAIAIQPAVSGGLAPVRDVTGTVVTTKRRKSAQSLGTAPVSTRLLPNVVTTVRTNNGIVDTPCASHREGDAAGIVHPTPQMASTTGSVQRPPSMHSLSTAQFIRRLSSAEVLVPGSTSSKDCTDTPIRGSDVISRVIKSSRPVASSPFPEVSQGQRNLSVKAKPSSKSLLPGTLPDQKPSNPDQAINGVNPVTQIVAERAFESQIATTVEARVLPTNVPDVRTGPVITEQLVTKPAHNLELTTIPRKRHLAAVPLNSTASRPTKIQATTTTAVKRRPSIGASKPKGTSKAQQAIRPLASTEQVITTTVTKATKRIDPPPASSTKVPSVPSASAKRDPNETSDRIRSACQLKLRELQAIEDAVPREGFWDRRAKLVEQVAKLHNPWELDRFRLESQHRATHEVLRRRIIEAARGTIWSIYDSPVVSSIDKAKRFLTGVIQSYVEETTAILQHQALEADTLHALFSREMHGVVDGPPYLPTFSFPRIFAEVMDCLPEVN